MSTWSFVRAMLGYRPWLYTIDGIVWIGVYGSRLLPGLVAQAAFNALAAPADSPPVLWFAALFVGVGAAQAGVYVAGLVIDSVYRASLSSYLQRNLLAEILRRPGARAIDRTPGEALTVFRDDVLFAENGVDQMLDMLFYLIVAVGALAILIRINATVAVFAFLPLVAVVGVAQALTARIRSARTAMQSATSRVTGALGEVFGAVQAIQLARAEDGVVEHFRAISEERRRAVLREQTVVLAGQSVQLGVVNLGTGLILLLGAQAMRAGSFTVGDFALFVSYLGFVTESATFAGFFVTQFKQLGVSIDRMLALVGVRDSGSPPTVLVRPARTAGAPDRRGPPPVLARLEARHLSYAPAPGANALVDASFALEAGTFTVVTGRIGAGKSTLLRTVLGLLPRSSGTIHWNDEEIRDPAEFLAPPRCAYVPQTPTLFSITLLNNILLGDAEALPDVASAVHAAVLEDDVRSLDSGLQTLVGPRGARLSGGQVQRAAGARAFVRRPQLLVVDDLSSALDVDTERALWERVLALRGLTVLAVSHRRPVLRRADQVVVMNAGRIESVGRLRDLLKDSPEMARLWDVEAGAS